MRRKKIWLVVKPDYGDHDGLPQYAASTRSMARDVARELNSPWKGVRPRIAPYKVRSFEMEVR